MGRRREASYCEGDSETYKLKIQQHVDLHNDREMGKLRHEDDEYWNFHGLKAQHLSEIYDSDTDEE